MAGKDQRPEMVGVDGSSLWSTYGIDENDLTNATPSTIQGHVVNGPGFDYAVLTYIGSSALTLSEFNDLPVGSRIFDIAAKKIHMKTAATTWVSSAAMS